MWMCGYVGLACSVGCGMWVVDVGVDLNGVGCYCIVVIVGFQTWTWNVGFALSSHCSLVLACRKTKVIRENINIPYRWVGVIPRSLLDIIICPGQGLVTVLISYCKCKMSCWPGNKILKQVINISSKPVFSAWGSEFSGRVQGTSTRLWRRRHAWAHVIIIWLRTHAFFALQCGLRRPPG
jgi:hypothetical protein